MAWIDVFRGFLSLCGAAVGIFVIIQLWKAIFQMRRDMPPLSAEQRRENWFVGLGTAVFMVLAAGAVYGAYRWGTAQWDSRTGAGLAIGVFVMAIIVMYTVMIMLARRDARLDRERHSEGEQSS